MLKLCTYIVCILNRSNAAALLAKSELAKSELATIATYAGSVSSSGFQREITAPAESLKRNPPSKRWGTSALGYIMIKLLHFY